MNTRTKDNQHLHIVRQCIECGLRITEREHSDNAKLCMTCDGELSMEKKNGKKKK